MSTVLLDPPATDPTPEEMREWLETDTPYYARNCIKIVDQSGRTVKLEAKPGQLRVEAALKAQELAGLPMRVIVPKARKEGVSTWVEAKMVQRVTTRENHQALVVAHNKKTTGKIHAMAVSMIYRLPQETVAGLDLHPPIVAAQREAEIAFGVREKTRRQAGELGLNSSLTVDTAGEVDTSRGITYFDLHLSEYAFWPDPKETMKALLNTVPDDPNTMIVIESTANGRNDFYRRCIEARDGGSDYTLVFLAWFEEPLYIRPFASPDAREQFIADIGLGPYGDDEPELIELMRGAPYYRSDEEILMRLNWRRWAIVNRTSSDLEDFHQEYPSTLEEAFAASASQVFSQTFVAREARRIAELEPAEQGVLACPPENLETVMRRGHAIQIPKLAKWTPRAEILAQTDGQIHTAYWDIYEHPIQAEPPSLEHPEGVKPGQYVVFCDPASGEEMAQQGSAYSAIQVINHRTLEQAAEFRSKGDPGVLTMQSVLAALYFNRAWLAFEITGGYGNYHAMVAWKDMRYALTYFRRSTQSKKEKQEERLGWQTSPATKPMMIDRGKELLRTDTTGIRSPQLVHEMTTYVRDDKGRTGPEEAEFADLLMSWLGAQMVAHEKPLRSGGGAINLSTHRAA